MYTAPQPSRQRLQDRDRDVVANHRSTAAYTFWLRPSMVRQQTLVFCRHSLNLSLAAVIHRNSIFSQGYMTLCSFSQCPCPISTEIKSLTLCFVRIIRFSWYAACCIGILSEFLGGAEAHKGSRIPCRRIHTPYIVCFRLLRPDLRYAEIM